ncbi:MAG: hypothetical protein IPL45_00180 [Actinomycetales bacterium]|nr:hypothetical protein [Actinomycetales bacterium]
MDSAHAIVTGAGLTREWLYVLLTRAREANTAYVCTDRAAEPLAGFANDPLTAQTVLESVLGHVGAATSAHEVRDGETETATSIRTLAAEYETIAHHAQASHWHHLPQTPASPPSRSRRSRTHPPTAPCRWRCAPPKLTGSRCRRPCRG